MFAFQWPIEERDEPWKRLRGHSRRVYSLSWAPVSGAKSARGSNDNHLWMLASASADGTVRVWWLAAPNLDLPNELRDDADYYGDQENRVYVEDEEEMEPSSAICCCVLGHPCFVYCVEFCGSRPGAIEDDDEGSPRRQLARMQHVLATSGFDGIVRLWTIKGRVARVCLNRGNKDLNLLMNSDSC